MTSLIARSQSSALAIGLAEEGEQQPCVLAPVLRFCKRPWKLHLPLLLVPQAAALLITLKNWGIQLLFHPMPVIQALLWKTGLENAGGKVFGTPRRRAVMYSKSHRS